MQGPYRVYVGFAPEGYLSGQALAKAVREGLSFCQLNHRIQGKIVLRPDLVGADEAGSPYVYTNPQLIRELLHILESPPFLKDEVVLLANALSPFKTENVLLQAHGGVPSFKSRGYYHLQTLFPSLSIQSVEASGLQRYVLSKNGLLDYKMVASGVAESVDNERLRYFDSVTTSKHFADAECLIYMPKVRLSLSTDGFSGALRLGLSNLVPSDYGKGLDRYNDRRMVDLLEVANPDIVISDGVILPFGGNELTAPAHELGMVLVSNNALAHDIIAAKIFNMDWTKITHLRMAAARGWGPNQENQILLGGGKEIGKEIINQFQAKTRQWRRPASTVDLFLRQFEREDPQQVFPLDVIEGQVYEKSGVHGVFLNWLHRTYDQPLKRKAMARWPRCAVILGETNQLPRHRVVYIVGNRAWHRFQKDIIETRFDFTFKGLRFLSCRLRDSRGRLVIVVPGAPPTERDISLAFLLGSIFRTRTGYLRMLLPHRVSERSGELDKKMQSTITNRCTSEMKKNQWWAGI